MKINESTKSYIQSKIPHMAKNIHEGIFDFVRGAAQSIGRAASREFEKQRSASAQSMLERRQKVESTVLLPKYSQRLGMSIAEMRRLHNEVSDQHPSTFASHAGGPPALQIPDPANPAKTISNPQYQVHLAEYQNNLQDWHKKQQMLGRIAGINATDRTLGHLHRELYGDFVPGDPAAGVAHTFKGGSLQRIQSKI